MNPRDPEPGKPSECSELVERGVVRMLGAIACTYLRMRTLGGLWTQRGDG